MIKKFVKKKKKIKERHFKQKTVNLTNYLTKFNIYLAQTPPINKKKVEGKETEFFFWRADYVGAFY